MKNAINKESFELTNILAANCQYPDLLLDTQGNLHVSWQEYSKGHDSVHTARLEKQSTVDVRRISGDGDALRPILCAFDGGVWSIWSECINRSWSILAREQKNGVYGNVITVDTSEAAFYPSACCHQGRLLVFWTEQGKGFSRIVARALGANGVGEKEIVSTVQKAYRATACSGGDGNLYVAYDTFNGKNYDLLARVKTAAGWSTEHKVSNNADWASNPIVISAADGATVGWYDFGALATFSYLTADLTVKDGAVQSSTPDRITEGVDWYQNIAMSSNKNGVAVFAYTWGKYDVHVRYRKGHGAWSNPVVMSYWDGHCGTHPKILVDDNDMVHLLWQFSHKNGHLDRNGCIVYNRLTLPEIDRFADLTSEVGKNAFTKPIPAAKELSSHSAATTTAWLKKNGYEGLQLKFGDIHGQSGISDGVGEIDQYYHCASVNAGLDFTALTDHDCYPDWISQSEWEWMRTTNRLMNVDGELSCLLAYEWTPNEYKYDYGHKNVYYRGDDGEMFRSGDIGGMTPFKLFESIKKFDAMCIPHHPAANWGLVSAATDWNFHDPEVQRLVEIFSRHAPFETFESTSKYTKNIQKLEGCSVQDALARGYRLGFTAGSDSHQMEHGIEGGILGAFIPSLTRENVYDAMYSRLVYATTGARILVSLRANGAQMGSELALKTGESLELAISVLGTAPVTVELLKNNQVIETRRCTGTDCDFTVIDNLRGAADCYYVRVTQADEHMAWSSPIWVDRAE